MALALASAMLVLTLVPQEAHADDWRLSAVRGVVRVASPGRTFGEALVNQDLPVGTTVTTGAGSRATLVNGAQRIEMAANSRMTIAPDSSDAMTRIMQDVGALLFQVDRRDAQHFRVETPLLAAVVKGTTFTVSAGLQADTVHVAQGLVEVQSRDGLAATDVAVGASARVARTAPSEIALIAPQRAASLAPKAVLPPMDYAGVSHGVVEGPSGQTAMGARGTPSHAPGVGDANGNGVADTAGFGQSLGQANSVTTAVALANAATQARNVGSGNGEGVAGNGNQGAGNSGQGNGNQGAGNSGQGNGNDGAGNSGPGNGNQGAENSGPGIGNQGGAGNSGQGNSDQGGAGNSGQGNSNQGGAGNSGQGNSNQGGAGSSGQGNSNQGGAGNSGQGNGNQGGAGNSGQGNGKGSANSGGDD